jgi:hypothetical protein
LSEFGIYLRKASHGIYLHWCPGCNSYHGIWTDPEFPCEYNGKKSCWTFNGSQEKPHFHPSINIVGQCHYYLHDGILKYQPDCKHKFAGLEIPLPPFDFVDDPANRIRTEKYRTMFVHFMPMIKEAGVLYISHNFRLAIHLCACGCGQQAVMRIAVNGLKKAKDVWDYAYHNDDGSSTLHASILDRNCKAHYYIQRGRVVWCE